MLSTAAAERKPQQENPAPVLLSSVVPAALEQSFQSAWNLEGERLHPYQRAASALGSAWLWLANSPSHAARMLREGLAKRADVDGYQLRGVGAAEGTAKMCRDTSAPTSTLARMENRDVELLDTLRGFQNGMQQLAAESEAIRRLRQIVAPDHMEEVLNLVKRINL